MNGSAKEKEISMKRLALAVLVMFTLIWPSLALARPAHKVIFSSAQAVGYMPPRIESCPTMVILFFEATATSVGLYQIDPDDDTVAEILAAPLVATYTATSVTQTVINPSKMFIQFFVNTPESNVNQASEAWVYCINSL